MYRHAAVAALMAYARLGAASIEDVARLPTPPMGFNDWARFECAINESLFTQTADAMKDKGLLDAGYDRVNIDDCWPTKQRAANGSLQWNETLFPNGLIWLSDYVKQRGFHFGIYSDAGNETCGGYPGSLGYEETDAQTFTSWGIDYLKLDGCNVYNRTGQTLEQRYQEIYGHWHHVLKGPETPLIFSESAPAYFSAGIAGATNLTDWYEVMDWVPIYGELARHSQDIATHEYRKDPWNSVMSNYDEEVRVGRVQAPGYYNDPDFLIADEPYLTLEEKKSHFALWATLGAPLIISAWIPGLPDEVVGYLSNERFISVDQDKLGLQATLVRHDGTWDVLTKPLANGDRVVTMLNNGTEAGDIEVSLAQIGLALRGRRPAKLAVTELWTGEETCVDAEAGTMIKASVPSHGTAAYRISVKDGYHHRNGVQWAPTGLIFNAASFHCLTDADGGLQWAPCNGSDHQVWRVGRHGSSIKPLSSLDSCVVPDGGSVKLSKSCRHGQWNYSTSGNVRTGSGVCLTEGEGGEVTVTSCGYLRNDQVFELPSGWQS